MSLAITEKKKNELYEVKTKTYAVVVDVKALKARVKAGPVAYEFMLEGLLSFRKAGVLSGDALSEGPLAGLQASKKNSALVITGNTQGPLAKKIITLDFKETHFTYALSVSSSEDLAVWDVTYGVTAKQKSASTFDEFYIWCPDRYQSQLPANQSVEIRLSTTRMPDEGFFRGDIGKYLVPPYIAAFRQKGHWAGFATMEIPSSQLGFHMIATRQDYCLNFRFSHNTAVKKGRECALPKVGFFFAAERDAVLSGYVDTLYDSKLAPRPATWAPWWAEPIYCNYADQVYNHTLASGIMKDEGGSLYNCSAKFISDRLAIFDKHDIPYGTVIVDFGWMDFLGDYNPRTDRFANMRAWIDGLHKKGKHVLLWFAPFFCESESEMAKKHPNWFLTNRDGSVFEHNWMKRRIFTPDFGNPEVRDYAQTVITRLLSDKPGCVNADGFKIDGYSFLPDVDHGFFDPAWGVGDMFQYKADKFVYQASKKAKKDALIENSFANPFLNDTQDLCRLNDASSYDTDLYENRARVALLTKVAVPDTDDWSAFKKMFVHSTLRKSVYGIPALYAIEYRGAGRMGGASGGYPVSIPAADYARVSAILRCYQHCPIDPSQERFIDSDLKVFWRKHTTGPLKGSYASASLAGNTAIAAFTEKKIMLAAITETQVVVPIPKGFKVKETLEVMAKGKARKPRTCPCGQDLVLWMLPSDGTVDHYEIVLAKA